MSAVSRVAARAMRVRELRVRPLCASAAGGALRATAKRLHRTADDDAARAHASEVSFTFVNRDGSERVVRGREGESLLQIAHERGIDLEGACEGSLACSTCHVYLDQASFDKLDEPCDDENDMLDLAFALSELSRLGCQVKLSKQLQGMRVTLPPATRNMAVDGFVPQPH